MTVMLDSDACIHIMKRDPRMKPKADLSECGISQIVLGVLEYGVCNSPANRQSLYDFLSAVHIHPLTNAVAVCYGEFMRVPNLAVINWLVESTQGES